MNTKKINEFLTIKEAAEFLGVSDETLRVWGNKKLIGEYRNPMNNYRLYDKEELEELLNTIEKKTHCGTKE